METLLWHSSEKMIMTIFRIILLTLTYFWGAFGYVFKFIERQILWDMQPSTYVTQKEDQMPSKVKCFKIKHITAFNVYLGTRSTFKI